MIGQNLTHNSDMSTDGFIIKLLLRSGIVAKAEHARLLVLMAACVLFAITAYIVYGLIAPEPLPEPMMEATESRPF